MTTYDVNTIQEQPTYSRILEFLSKADKPLCVTDIGVALYPELCKEWRDKTGTEAQIAPNVKINVRRALMMCLGYKVLASKHKRMGDSLPRRFFVVTKLCKFAKEGKEHLFDKTYFNLDDDKEDGV